MMIVIADDLTGANDTAVQYCKVNIPVIVDAGIKNEKEKSMRFEDYSVISFNTDTRAMTPENAYKAVFSVCREFCGKKERIYKKIDSLLRGNPGVELDAVMDALKINLAIVAPSYPQNDRVVINGVLQSGEKRIDALAVFASDMKRSVEMVCLDVVRLGAKALAEYIGEKQKLSVRVFICDSETDEDLQIVYDAALLFKDDCVLCGSAGLAAVDAMHMTKSLHAPVVHEFIKRKGIILMLTGSRSERTRRQIEKASKEYNSLCIMLDKDLIVNKEADKAVQKCMEQIRSQVLNGSKVIFVCLSSLFDDFKMVLKDSKENYRIAYELSDCLGRIAAEVFNDVDVCAFVLNGGDTTMQLCRHLDAYGIEPVTEISPGTPVGIFIGGKADKVPVITKSGAFGGEDVTIKCIRFLEKYRED